MPAADSLKRCVREIDEVIESTQEDTKIAERNLKKLRRDLATTDTTKIK